MRVTFKHLFRKIITTQYPDMRLATSRRIRGQQFAWKEDLCTGCATCAKSCPHGIIQIETSKNGDNKYFVKKILIDTGRCMFCGLCVEACPYNALFMGRSYEQAQYSRKLLWADKKALTSPDIELSAYWHPELEEQIPKQSLLVYEQFSEEMVGRDDN